MTILQQGLDDWRDLIAAEITDGQLGSDGTAVEIGDAGLGTAIAGTNKTITNTTFHNGIKTEYVTTIGDGSGNTAREFILENVSNSAQLRMAFPGIDIDGSTVMEVDTQILLIQEFN